ncbi:MAG TPA: sulfurtransferase [Gammaproteobacteria bacterium]|nr:sulfurtransferase [Gammaproteobacteria bacterium]
MREMSAEELRDYLKSAHTSPILLDVREPWEYDICSLEHSRLIPMRQLPAAALDLDPQKEYVMICHHGIRSRQAALYLERTGFDSLINLNGGMDAWARTVDLDMDTY